MDLLLFLGLIFRILGFLPFIFTVFPRLFQEARLHDGRQAIRQLLLFALTMYVATDTFFILFTLYRFFNHIFDLYADIYTIAGGVSFLITGIAFYLIYNDQSHLDQF